MKVNKLLATCLLLLTAQLASAQRAGTLVNGTEILKVKSGPSSESLEKSVEVGNLKRRRRMLLAYFSSVSPESKDYQVTQRAIREIDSKLEAMEPAARADSLPAAPALTPAHDSSAQPPPQDDEEGYVAALFAAAQAASAPPTGCPDDPPAGDFNLSYEYRHLLSARKVDDGPQRQRGALAFIYDPNDRFELGFGLHTFQSRFGTGIDRVSGLGDASASIFYDAAPLGSPLPVGLYYEVNIPTASVSKGFGSGRFDHTFQASFPRKFGKPGACSESKKNTVELDAGVSLVGRTDADGYDSVGLLTLIYERKFGSLGKHAFHFEVDGSSRAGANEAEAFALGWIKFRLSNHTWLRVGSRAGITENSARFGFFIKFGLNGTLSSVFKGS